MPTADRWTEAKIQRWFIIECKRYGLFVAKVASKSFRGFPDVVVSGTLLPAPVFVEMKTHKGSLLKSQERCLHDMREAGMDVRVYYGKAQAEEFFRVLTRTA